MPDLSLRTYDPKLVTITFGRLRLAGFAEGTFVKVARNGAAFEKSRGADGSMDRVNKNALDFTVTVTLKQTNPVNDELSKLMLADQIGNVGVLPFIIKDLGGSTLFSATQAYIAKDPDMEFGDSLGSREWTFETGIAANLVGSN